MSPNYLPAYDPLVTNNRIRTTCENR